MGTRRLFISLRLVLSAMFAVAAGVALPPLVPAQAANITPPPPSPAPPFATSFEIDGNKVDNNSYGALTTDWNDLLTFNPVTNTFSAGGTTPPYTLAPQVPGQVEIQSTGIIESAGAVDLDLSGLPCTGSNDPTAFPGSVTIDDYPWSDDIGTANVNNKSDACTGAAAWEIVRVRKADNSYDQNHIIYYQYWTRSFNATGEVTVFQAFADNNEPNNCGDFLVAFDYNSSTKDIENFRTYEWVDTVPDAGCTGAGGWGVASPAVTAGDGAAGFNTDVIPAGQTANDGTFGESAIDLTSAGVLTGDTCETFTAGDVVLKTGQSDEAQLLDLMEMPPIQISNCNQVDVTKVSSTGVEVDDLFTYRIAQRDGLAVHDSSLTGQVLPSGPAVIDIDGAFNSITADIAIGDTHRWSNVQAQPDYWVDEIDLPDGWQLQSIVCTYQDAFLPGAPEQVATIYANGAYIPNAAFKIFPPQLGLDVPECIITNAANTVTIVKNAEPNTSGAFNFGASLNGVAQPGFQLVDNGTPGTNSETFVVTQRAGGNFDSFFENTATNPPFYEFANVLCAEAGQQLPPGGDVQVTLNEVGGAQPGVNLRIAPGPVRNITCTFTNEAGRQPYHILVTPATATNRLTDPHTFFVELRTDIGDDGVVSDPVINATVNLTWSGAAGSAIVNVNGVNVGPTSSTTCVTADGSNFQIPAGTCQVTVSSPSDVGSGTLTASFSIPAPGPGAPELPAGNQSTTALNPTIVGDQITAYTGVADVQRIQAIGLKTWVGYLVDVEPDGTNPLGADHTFTVTVDRTDGTTSTDANGVTVNLSWNPGTATGSTINQVNLPGVIAVGGLTATCVTNASGVCTVTVRDGDVAGTGTLTVTSVEGNLLGQGVGVETPTPSSDLTGTKTWVAHRVIVAETDTNAVGQPHTFTVLAEINDGTGWVELTAGTVAVTWNAGTASGSTITNVVTGTIAPDGLSATCDLAAANPCQVTVNSPTDFGTGTLTATTLNATVGVPGAYPVINADNNASKTWVQFQTSVAATETNLTGEPHTFTITAQYVDDAGAPDAQPVPDGTVVNFTFAGTGSVTLVNGAPAPGATTCVTTGGTCTVTVSSSSPGSGTITVTGIESVVIDGDELAPGAVVLSSTVIPGGSQTAVKTWALYAVDVSDDATNLLGDDHVFTISVTRDTGSGPVAASGVTVNYTWAGPAGSTASPTTACVTGVSGTCTVTVDSNTATGPGTLTVTSLGTSEGPIALTYADGTTGTPQAANGLNTATSDGRGVKQWWAYDVDISGDDANLAGQSHTFTVTARVDKGDGLGLVPVADGSHVTATTSNSAGNGAIVGTGDAGAQTTCLTTPGTGAGTAAGACTIVVDGTQPGATTVTLTSLLADGFTIDLTSANTDGIGWSAQFDDPVASTKYWVQYRVTVTPNADENPLTVEHVFTITVETTIDGTTWVPAVAGTLVDYDWTGPVGSTEDPADTCTLGAAGTCTVTVDSNTNPGLGTLTVTGIRNSSVITPDGTLIVPNADLTAAGALYVAAASDLDGTKTWAGYKVIVTDDGRNPRNHEHDFTVTLYKTTDAALYAAAAGLTDETTPAFDPTGWTVVTGASLGLAWSGDGQITSIVTGTVNAGGLTGTCITTCTVTVNNPTDGFGTLTVTSVNGPQQEAIPAFQNDDATKEWVGFNVDITGDATNPAGDEHEFVVTVEVIDGVTGTAAPAPDGTIVGFTVLPAATVIQPATTCDNGTVGGECSIVIVAGAAGTHTVTVTSLTFLPGNDVIDEPLNTPISLTVDEQVSADKTFRQYRITTEDDATNLSGEDHTFTFTVEYTENGTTWNPLADSTVQFAADDPSAILAIVAAGPSPLTCVTDASGQCDVTVTSADTGSVTVSVVSITDTLPTGLPAPDDSETFTLPVTDTTAVVSTDSATKTWIAFDVDITPSTDTNRVDDEHTFTITVRVDPGTGTLVAHTGGGSVGWSFAGPDGPQTGSCTLDPGGTCTVTLNSGTPGTGTLTATSLTATFNGESFGPIDLTVAADGQAPALTVPPTAQKTWIEILANVEASEINLAGDDHVFTLTAYYDDGTGALKPANGASFDFSWSGPAGSLVSPAASPCVAAADSNTCLVTVSSDVGANGTITIDSVTVTVNGVTFTDEVPVAAEGDSLSAVKTWIAYLVTVTPAEADNLTGDDHIMYVYVQADIGGGFLPLEGATVTFTFPGAGGTGTVIDGATETPPGSGTYQCVTEDPDPVPGDPACEITVSSSVAGTGTLTVTQIASASIGGLPVPIANVTADAVYIDDESVTSGSKTWQEFRVDVEADGTNPLGQEHPFTITVTRNLGDGNFVPVGGVTVTYDWVGPAGSTIAPHATTCTTAGDGTCDLVVDSDTNAGLGQLTVTQLSTLPDGLPPIDLTYANAVTQTPQPADGLAADSDGRAVKAWAEYRVVITPPADSNLTGQPHVFTLTAESRTDTGDWATDPDVGKITFLWNGPAGSTVVGATPTGNTDEYECTTVAGVCLITVESTLAGTGTITAVSVNDVLVDGVPTETILVVPTQATKTWVEYRVDVSDDAVNLLGEEHEFTITVTQNSGSGFVAAAGVSVDYSWTGPAGSTLDPPSPCVTDASGHCVVTVDSDTTTGDGTLQIDGLSDLSHNGIDLSDIDLTYSGGTDVPDTADGLDAAGSDGQGVKSWWAYDVDITGDDANLAGQSHVFTVTATVDMGEGPVAVDDGATVTVDVDSPDGDGAIVAAGDGGEPTTCLATPPGPGTGAGTVGGSCTIVVDGTLPGSTIVTATSLAVDGFVVDLTTQNVDAIGWSATFDGPVEATKFWVQYRVNVTPNTSNNLLSQNHVITIDVDTTIDGATWVPALDGTAVDYLWSGPAGSTATPPATCTITGGTGSCQVVVDSEVNPGTGTLTVTGIRNATLDTDAGPLSVPPADLTGADPLFVDLEGSDLDGSKTWLQYRIDVGEDGVNLVGEDHPFTIVVEYTDGTTGEGGLIWQPAAGIDVSFTWTGTGTIAPPSPCTTDAGGTCDLTVNSAVTGTGTLTVTGLDVSGGDIDFDGATSVTVTYPDATSESPTAQPALSDDSDGRATKQWVDFRISVTPEQATNEISDPHTFTVLLERDTGSGFAPLVGETVSISGAGTGAITAIVTGTVGSGTSGSCTTNAGGTCAVTVNSGEPGSFTVTASYTAVVAEASKTVTDSGVKQWIFPPNADLAIVKNASVATAERGGTFNWILDTVNNGPGPAINAVVSDTVPAPFVVTSVSGTAGWACSNAGNVVTCTKAFVAVGETAQFNIAVNTPGDAPAGTITNTGSVQATTPDPNLANNSDDASVQIPEIIVQPPAPPVLPRTGASAVTTLLRTAALLLAVGFVVWGIGRRRTADDAG